MVSLLCCKQRTNGHILAAEHRDLEKCKKKEGAKNSIGPIKFIKEISIRTLEMLCQVNFDSIRAPGNLANAKEAVRRGIDDKR